MSSSRSRASKISEDEINDLVLKLQALLPQLHQRHYSSSREPAVSMILEETCSYIRKLRREIDDLSERLSQGLDSTTISGSIVVMDFLTTFLQQ